jgi:hypothetical protein
MITINKIKLISTIEYYFSTATPIKKPQIKKFYQKASIEKNLTPEHQMHIWQIKLDGK